MSVIKSMRRQRAVYWARTTADSHGRFSFAEPVQIKCRWDENRGHIRNYMGEMVATTTTVYVDRIMQLGDRLKRGELDSYTLDDPTEDPLAFEIQAFEETPNYRNSETLLTAHL